MYYSRTKPTDWDKYHHNRPTNPLIKWFFLDVMVNAYKKLLKNASLSKCSSIIELGSGTGYVTKELSLLLNSDRITLVDSNAGMLEISKNTFKGVPVSAKFINSDFFDLKIKDKFDLVHSAGVVEHFTPSKQLELIKLHANLLSPNGYCIIFVPTPTLSYRFFRKLAETIGVWKYTDEIPMTESELVSIVYKAGLTVLATTYFWKNYYLSEVGVIAKKQPTR